MRTGFGAVVGLALLLVFAVSPTRAEPLPAQCAALVALVQDFTDYLVKAAPAGEVDGWCVLNGVRLVSPQADWPDLKVDTLRIRGEAEVAVLTAVEVEAKGLRLVQGLGAKQLDERLQAMFRLQSADLAFRAELNAEAGRVEVRGFTLALSGGTEVTLKADLAGADLSPLGVLAGRLTMLELAWKADRRLLRGLMTAVVVVQDDDLVGSGVIRVVRDRLQGLIDALPGSLLDKESREQLEKFAAALPEVQGTLQLTFDRNDGIGAADILVVGLSKAPLDQRLATLFAGSRLQAVWNRDSQP